MGEQSGRGAPAPRFIYGLIDPRDNRLRYVGRAVNPEHRRRQHIASARKGSGPPCAAWIREVLDAGMEPGLVILEQTTRDEAPAREVAWIATYRPTTPDLCNTYSYGGREPSNPGMRIYRKNPLTPEDIVAFRTERAWSQHDLARALGVHHSTVSLWESGKRTPGRMVRLALDEIASQET